VLGSESFIQQTFAAIHTKPAKLLPLDTWCPVCEVARIRITGSL
jgi:hypothetical protein